MIRPGFRAPSISRLAAALLLCLAGPAGIASPPAEEGFPECLTKAARTFEALGAYRCFYDASSGTNDGKRSESFRYEYAFRKPKLIRMKVLEGRSRDSILLYDQSRGKVRLRLGSGLLASLTVSLSPASPKLADLQGHGIDHSDWGWFISQHQARQSLFDSRDLGRDEVEGRSVRLFELVSRDPARTQGIAREKVWFDPERSVFVRYQIFNDRGVLIQSGAFTRIVLDPDLSPSLFREF